MKSFTLAAVTAALVASAMPAAAAVLTFDGYSNTIFNAPQTVDGFIVGNVSGDEQHFHFVTGFSGEYVQNGTSFLANDRDSRIFLTLDGGGLFTFAGFDGAATRDGAAATGAEFLRVTGYVGGVQTASFDYGVNSVAFQSFAGLAGAFDEIVFDGINGGGGFQLDNINVTAGGSLVPEPATWALLIAGFGLSGAMLRRRTVATA